MIVQNRLKEVIDMINSVSLFTCGVCIAPENWFTKNIPTPYRLYYIRGGSAYFSFGAEEFKLRKNHFYLFPSSLPFVIRQDPNDRLDHLFYNFLLSPSVMSANPISADIHTHPLFEKFLEIMEITAWNYAQNKTTENKDIAAKVLEAFLTLFFSVNPISKSENNDILASITYMETNYMHDITIKEIASGLFLSEDYFIRKFKASIGMTPYAYLSKLRLSIANELIASGVSLTDAAKATGFKYVSSLSHALKKKS